MGAPVRGLRAGIGPGASTRSDGKPVVDPALSNIVSSRAAREEQERRALAALGANTAPPGTAAPAPAPAPAPTTPYQTDPLAGLSPEQRAEYARQQALQDRFGSKFSWLDPTFQMANPTLLGQSAGALAQSDPLAQLAQYNGLGRANQMANTQLALQGSGEQDALKADWSRIIGGQGAPDFTGADADQRRAFEQAMGLTSNTGPGALTFDDGSRQLEQYNNLRGIIAGGGADTIERAARQRQRGEEEAWLRGQREADMQDYAERGLTGSGQELLALSADRQAAAGRNSLADLQTASDLEKRRMDAILGAGDLATNMRGNTIDEQSLLSNRSQTGISAAASLANSMRDANYNEKTYLDERMIEALKQKTDLSGKTRDQQLLEQEAQRKAQYDANQQYLNTADDIRKQSWDEATYRADRADDWTQYNVDTVNTVQADNTAFLRDAWANMIKTQEDTEKWRAEMGIKTAEGLMGHDQKENVMGFGLETQKGLADAASQSDFLAAYNRGKLGNYNLGHDQTQTARNQVYDSKVAGAGWLGELGDSIIGAAVGGPAAGAAGALGGAGAAAGGGAAAGAAGAGGWSSFLKGMGYK